MLCDVCGRDNPERLTFCQDCGKRLRPATGPQAAAGHSSRPDGGAAPITTRQSAAPLVAPDVPRLSERPRESVSDAPPSIGRRASRPEAPPFKFGFDDVRLSADAEAVSTSIAPSFAAPTVATAATAPAGTPSAAPSAAGESTRASALPAPPAICSHCGAANPPTHRFCTSCGGTIATSASRAPVERLSVPAPSSAITPVSLTPATDPLPLEAVVAAPVVTISVPQAAAAETVTCARCQGQCAASARYCKYCGATLVAAPPAPLHHPSDRASASPQPATHQQHHAAAVYGPAASESGPAASPQATPQAAFSPAAYTSAAYPHQAADPQAADPRRAAYPQQAAYPQAAPQPVRSAGPGLALAPPPSGGSAAAAWAAPAAAAPAPVEVASGSAPRLVVLRDDGSEGASFPLGVDVVDLGRREGDILLHDDLYVSPRHARFRREGNRVRVIDLASTNGIYVRLRSPMRLSTGNLILLGLEVLQFQLVKDAAPPASPHAPSNSAARPHQGGSRTGGASEAGGSSAVDVDAAEATLFGGRSPAAAAPGFLGQASQHGTLVFGSPAAPRRASLHQRTVEGIVRDVHHLVRDEVILGREGADIVFSADPYMSRRHAAIHRDPATDDYTLTDLDSSNGTFVRIENDAYLTHRDEIRIGRHLFRFESTGGPAGGSSPGVPASSPGHARQPRAGSA